MRKLAIAAAAAVAIWGCSSKDETNGKTTSSSSSAGTGGNATGGGGQGGTAPGGTGGTAPGGTGGTAPGGGGTGGTGGSGGEPQGGSGGDGGSGGQGGGSQACKYSPSSDSCGAGHYCDAPGCGAGTCKPIGTKNDGVKQAVCGCDGVSYWNAATAAAFGMAVQFSSQCPPTKICGGIASLKCPKPEHSCNRDVVVFPACQIVDNTGVCWGMPVKCDAIVIGGKNRYCADPKGPCAPVCDAAKSTKPYFQDNTCPT